MRERWYPEKHNQIVRTDGIMEQEDSDGELGWESKRSQKRKKKYQKEF